MKERVKPVIRKKLESFIREIGGNPGEAVFELQNTPSPEKGDYALNTALRLGKIVKQNPIVIAQKIAELLAEEKYWFKEVTVAPPGFVNIFFSDSAIEKVAFEMALDLSGELKADSTNYTVVVDYSSVNIAKQMHVGHLRSTIIGDVIARVLEARGANVIRQNHLGDWGLPIAMVLWKVQPILRTIENTGGEIEKELSLEKLEDIYRDAVKECSENPEADRTCHQILVALQNKDPQLLADWKKITRLSMKEVYRIYEQLGVTLTEEHERGESAYQDMLESTVQALQEVGILVESQGAKCVFLDEFKSKDGKPLPVIVQKSDGGFNYETFDLAGIRYRIDVLKAKRIIYVTDARQSLHFAQVFRVAQVAGWTKKEWGEVSLEHVPFGSVLGEDGKPLKTRSGENVKLAELLREAEERAYKVVKEKNPDLPEERKQKVAKSVGIGAVKYADLAQNRNNDYVFSWDKMLSLTGNTAPYLQYAHARICSIFRRGGVNGGFVLDTQPKISHPSERTLLLCLVRFPEMVRAVEAELRPHLLCGYLYDLATAFTTFYDQCPVLSNIDNDIRKSRLSICEMVRRTLAHGMFLLGIDAPQEM